MGISTAPGACCSLSLGDVWQCLAWQLLNVSGMPRWKAPTELQFTGADCSFPLSPWNADVSRDQAQVRHQAGYQHISPVCKHIGPSFHPSPTFPPFCLQEGLNKQVLSRGCRGAHPPVLRDIFPYSLPCVEGNKEGNSTLRERHTTGKLMILGIKRASSSLITFNWVRPGFRALVIQRWCHSKWSLDFRYLKLSPLHWFCLAFNDVPSK